MKYERIVTLADVRAAKPEKIFYGATTCWWSHCAEDLGKNHSGLPCDPMGGVLFETDDYERFLSAAEGDPEHYGRNGLLAFEAAHHGNVLAGDGQAVCFVDWEKYNFLIDNAKEG